MEILKITLREQGYMADYFREQGYIVSCRESPKNALKNYWLEQIQGLKILKRNTKTKQNKKKKKKKKKKKNTKKNNT